MIKKWQRVLICLTLGQMAASAQPGTITTFIGAYPEGIGGPATQAVLRTTGYLADDPAGNLYFSAYARIFRIDPTGRLTVFAGTEFVGSTGDEGPASLARLNAGPGGLVRDPLGNLIFGESNKIRSISPNGIIRTLAGTGVAGFSGDGGPALKAQMNSLQGLAVDTSGNLYAVDAGNHRIRKITTDGNISTVAGDGLPGYRGDGGPATQASLHSPDDIAVDSRGNIYIADSFNRVVRMVTPDGVISTIAGFNRPGSPQRALHGNNLNWSPIWCIAVDSAENLYISVNEVILKRTSTGTITEIAGEGSTSPDEYRGPASQANLTPYAGSVFVDRQNNVLLGIRGHVSKIDPAGMYSIIAGVGLIAGVEGPAAFALLNGPSNVAVDGNGILYLIEAYTYFRRNLPTGLSVGPGLGSADGLAVDPQGNAFVSAAINLPNLIEKIDPSGRKTAFAGTFVILAETGGFSGDGGPALKATFDRPRGLALDTGGSLYIADSNNHRIRKITPDGIINTIVGTGRPGFSGDGGPAIDAQINSPIGLTIDPAGNIYIGDASNNRIRKVTPAGIISTYAGTGQNGFAGDGGLATQARLQGPRYLALDLAGNLYFSEGSGRVRKITTGGTISTVAGNGLTGFSGDGGPAINAAFNNILGIALDGNGNLYIADNGNNRIRKVEGGAPFTVAPSSLLFSTTLGGAPSSSPLNLTSADGASRRYRISSNVPWLSGSPDTGSVSGSQTGRLAITANPTGLAKGTYGGILTIVDLDAGSATQVPVTLTVSGSAQQMRLSQVGLTFVSIQNGPAPGVQSLQVLNTGTGSMPWNAASVTLPAGAGWLAIAPTSGIATKCL